MAEKIAARARGRAGALGLHGTTGYRFASLVNGVFVDARRAAEFDRIWRGFTERRRDFEERAYRGKRAIMRSALASELTVLATELLRIARADRRTRDYTFNTLRDALAEVAACMPVYRTYIVGKPSAQDRRYIDWAVAQARRRSHAGRHVDLRFRARSAARPSARAGASAGTAQARCSTSRCASSSSARR